MTYGIDVEVAGIQNDWPVDVVVVHAIECDVRDVPISDIWAGPSLETCAVL